MDEKLTRIHRTLTPEQKQEYDELRAKVIPDFPPLDRHEGRRRRGGLLAGHSPCVKGEGLTLEQLAEQAKQLYENELKTQLEAKHFDEFVAIEPVSKSYYVADSFINAALAAKKAYPDRKSFVIRIGHEGAFHIGHRDWDGGRQEPSVTGRSSQ